MGGRLKRRGLIESQTPQMRVPETERRCSCIPGHQHATLHLESNPGQFSHESASPTEEKFTAHLRARPFRPNPTATAIGRHHQAAPPTALTPSPACTPSPPRPSLTLAPHIPPPPLHVQISQTAIAAEEGDEDPLRLCVFSPLPLSLIQWSRPPAAATNPTYPAHQLPPIPSLPELCNPSPLLSPKLVQKPKTTAPRNTKNRSQTCKPLEIVHPRPFSSTGVISRPSASFLVRARSFSCWSSLPRSSTSESRYVQTGDVSEKVRGRRAVPGPVPSVFARDVRYDVGYDFWLLGQ